MHPVRDLHRSTGIEVERQNPPSRASLGVAARPVEVVFGPDQTVAAYVWRPVDIAGGSAGDYLHGWMREVD